MFAPLMTKIFTMQAYEVEQIPGGMRILATTRPIEHRGMTLNLPTITVEFVAHTPDTIPLRKSEEHDPHENPAVGHHRF